MNLQLLIPVAFRNPNNVSDKPITILAGDIGGTKANMQLSRYSAKGLESIKECRYHTSDFNSFTALLSHFLEGQQQPEKICFSVAGPVIEGKVKFTNLSWSIDSEEVSKHVGGSPVAILNDLEATAYGLAGLKQEELTILYKGTNETPGNIAILAAGTGLGEAGLYFDGKLYHPFATEGGHCDFAPRTPRDIALLTFLLSRHEHVSWERLLSGNGIYTIWQYLTGVEKKNAPQWLLQQMENTDPAPVISKAALEGNCPVCIETIELFNRYLACEAVNLILKLKATGGLYLAGGITPKVLPLLHPEVWKDVFSKSGRMNQLLKEVTVYVVLNEKAPLVGAGYFACLSL
ncbi:glucokinase [Ferruginibacter paludis]|uniref:glucokinase n=1 Tax=Ferruginibacter paludis TaxID=1310417 RepID=UPI0025B57B62|nr:glucokinase [Ferruginibacter paludis]MDN3655011.1 glucokinase [Ferruginibacter paludis]